MSRVLIMAAASIAAGVLVAPSVAYAVDTTTRLSAAGMAVELKAVSATSMAVAASGWKATAGFTSPDLKSTDHYFVDPAEGIASSAYRFGGEFGAIYAVEGKGTYEYADNLTTTAAVTMMGRPSVRYVFTPKAVRLDTFIWQHLQSPAAMLTADVDHPGTKTVHGDGSRDYAFTNRDWAPTTIHVDPAGVLTSARAGSAKMGWSWAYAYGPQHVTLPTATVDARTLAAAVAYLRMPALVKGDADQGAADTRRAAKGKTVNVATLRAIVRRDVTACNSSLKVAMTKVTDISGGARVSATNPWTHRTVSYTVKASGTEVLVSRAGN